MPVQQQPAPSAAPERRAVAPPVALGDGAGPPPAVAVPPGGVLTCAFALTVAMWAVGYAGRLPAVTLPSPALFFALLACLLGGGALSARALGGGAGAAALVGGLSGVLNLLVLGGALAEGGRTAWMWVPAFIALSAALAGAGGVLARLLPRPAGARPAATPWHGAFCRVAAAATLLLLGVGGLVTSHDAGLAVPDWPNTYGAAMFLYPLSHMTGGVYYEHAHRLFGSLVGLTTLVMAVYLARADARSGVRWLGGAAFLLVVTQGLLGGLRVTGRLTLSQDAGELAPSTLLAFAHGVLGQCFFATILVLAAATSGSWLDPRAPRGTGATRATRGLGGWLVGALLLQLALGAGLRHFHLGAVAHATLGVVALGLATAVGLRAWGLEPRGSALSRSGLALALLAWAQVGLGSVTLVAIGAARAGTPLAAEPALATLHQTTGAVVLGLAVLVRAFSARALQDGPAPAGAVAIGTTTRGRGE